MSILAWILLGMVALKVLWNFSVPYALLRKPIDAKTGRRGGISLSLEIEILLLILATGISWLSKGDSLINRPLAVLGWGGGAILISYVHFFIGGIIADWLVGGNRRSRRREPPSST